MSNRFGMPRRGSGQRGANEPHRPRDREGLGIRRRGWLGDWLSVLAVRRAGGVKGDSMKCPTCGGWHSGECLYAGGEGPESSVPRQRTVTATKREHTVERRTESVLTVTEEMPVEPPLPAVIEPEPIPEPEAISEPEAPMPQIEAPEATALKVISHVPDDPPDTRELAETALKIYGADPAEFEWEGIFDQMEVLGERIHAYREAKIAADTLLSDWVDRNSVQLRHLGVGSKAVRDLWSTIQQLMWDKRRLEREAQRLCKRESIAVKDLDDMRKVLGIPEVPRPKPPEVK